MPKSSRDRDHSMYSYSGILAWYLLFGCLHELSHIIAAFSLGVSDGFFDDGLAAVLFRTIFGRLCIFPELDLIDDDNNASFVIRNTAWIFSVGLTLLVHFRTTAGHIRAAVWLTALEAVSTDLFGLKDLPGLGLLRFSVASTGRTSLYCGNFGIILLHQAWLSDNGKSALDVIERMVQITMMRGAQSGGVVTFRPKKNSLKGTRSRVVNAKRTDLSKLVRKKVADDVFGGFPRQKFPKGYVPVFSGHTRFATSSKATFDGTHPQQWSPPTPRRVYDFVACQTKGVHVPETKLVENYITHNGDFDFYAVNGKTYDLEVVQQWLVGATGYPMPAVVDSCAVAGMVDILRTQGCFGLSARYAILLGLSSSKITEKVGHLPSYSQFESVGMVFEDTLLEMLKTTEFERLNNNSERRHSFGLRVASKFENSLENLLVPLRPFLSYDEEHGGSSVLTFCLQTIHAFFDNDLLWTTRTFMQYGKGSFGLCITSSLDARRQIAFGARGQTISVAFYPMKGLICYGSEQAAVKAGLQTNFPGSADELGRSRGDVDDDVLRLDLDDLGGEIMLLDWGKSVRGQSPVSRPNANLRQHELMNGAVTAVLYQESHGVANVPRLIQRMTRLTRNNLVKPLKPESKDPVLSDIQDIPRICQEIQESWHSDRASTSLNRLTAYNLSRCLRKKLESHVNTSVDRLSVDILLTGCEVSLWLAEQFASDLQKAFPLLNIVAMSSNKLLGLYGQEISVPALGFPFAPKTQTLNDAIVIIVSHSGGTFAPLSCSNLLQSQSKDLFVVTSEWDTQIGKQLRAMDAMKDQPDDSIFQSRIFSTDVGVRPAEPCSVSVAATQQLLTNLFEYISVVILSDDRFRRVTGATITEQDLQILERANQDCIQALVEIVGVNAKGIPLDDIDGTVVEKQLRQAGDLWADHILECAKAYIMTFIYIFGCVTSGFPLISGIAFAAGLDPDGNWFYLTRFFDSMIYFWLPQINIFLIRLWQNRNLRHRMVGRTVAIADIPWVSQAAEAFLSKIFACSYSIAGLNVISGNPSDHFVHRHTHKVVRGSLLVCGRPDGRLSALATAEAASCLSVNQASSIQSLGGTCESITIGHNPFKLPLSKQGIFLKRKRPMFLCERILVENDASLEERDGPSPIEPPPTGLSRLFSCFSKRGYADELDNSLSFHRDSSVRPRSNKKRSAPALIGAYMNIEEQSSNRPPGDDEILDVESVIKSSIQEKKFSDKTRKSFQAMDADGDGLLGMEEFCQGIKQLKSGLVDSQARELFAMADSEGSGTIDYDEFIQLLKLADLRGSLSVPPTNRTDRGLIQIEATSEKYFGQTMRKFNAGKAKKLVDFQLARSQHFSQELYETRVASLQRFVSMTVLFHQMGMRVQTFFERMSFGLLGYRMDRTHSIMRIATTASPVSGAEVRQRMRQLQLQNTVSHAVNVISGAYLQYRERQQQNSESRVKSE